MTDRGSKYSLLPFIEEVVNNLKPLEENKNIIFCDIFSGTAVVGKHFKNLGYKACMLSFPNYDNEGCAPVKMYFSGVFGANVSFGGTSLIIVVGVVLETIKQVEAQLVNRHYTGFLND